MVSLGVGTNRDAWCYSASRQAVTDNMTRMIAFYNQEADSFQKVYGGLDKKAREDAVAGFINSDPTKISWSSSLIPDLVAFKKGQFYIAKLTYSLYRPFYKQWLYFDSMFNHRIGQMPRIFPEAGVDNLVIQFNAKYNDNGFIAIIANTLPDLHCNGDSQCFPLYLYEPAEEANPQGSLFAQEDSPEKYTRREAITDAGLAHFQEPYPDETISKEDVFYYVYGLLHSPEYRERYADNLSKELPRIPRVKTSADFWAFSKAGRELAELHLHYETVEPYPLTIEHGSKPLTDADYRV